MQIAPPATILANPFYAIVSLSQTKSDKSRDMKHNRDARPQVITSITPSVWLNLGFHLLLWVSYQLTDAFFLLLNYNSSK
jgi:hypothetical protein